MSDKDIESVLNDMMDIHGYDFTNYSRASIRRRIMRLLMHDKFPSFAEFRFRIRTDPFYFQRFVEQITVNVTEMFRDVGFYKTLREQVLPMLATWPMIRIWHAGCSTGKMPALVFSSTAGLMSVA